MKTKLASGFTLVELLVVISIISLLLSILVPALGTAREQARQVVCQSNMRQLYVGIYQYTLDYNGYLPMAWANWGGALDKPTWYTEISAYLSYKDSVYPAKTVAEGGWHHRDLSPNHPDPPKVLVCPSRKDGLMGYGWNYKYCGMYPAPGEPEGARRQKVGTYYAFGDGGSVTYSHQRDVNRQAILGDNSELGPEQLLTMPYYIDALRRNKALHRIFPMEYKQNWWGSATEPYYVSARHRKGKRGGSVFLRLDGTSEWQSYEYLTTVEMGERNVFAPGLLSYSLD